MRRNTTSPTSPARVRPTGDRRVHARAGRGSGGVTRPALPSGASWQMIVHLCYITLEAIQKHEPSRTMQGSLDVRP